MKKDFETAVFHSLVRCLLGVFFFFLFFIRGYSRRRALWTELDQMWLAERDGRPRDQFGLSSLISRLSIILAVKFIITWNNLRLIQKR